MRGGSAALVGLAALAALGCRPQGGGGPPPQTVKVSSVQELAEALGPDRVIELAPGEYNLGRLERRTRRHLVWGDPDSTYDKTTPVIRGLRNLTLRGTGGKRVRLVTDCANSWVLKLEDVSGLRLENLELGHLPETPGCWGGVLGITKARRVTIRNCRLFGCGHEGLVLEAVKGLVFERSVIDRCRASILEANGCRGLLFRDSEFRDNKVYRALIKMRLCEEVAFESCRAEGNSASGTKAALFTVRLGPEVEFKGGAVTGNKAAWLENRRGAVRFEGTDIEGNSFPEGRSPDAGYLPGEFDLPASFRRLGIVPLDGAKRKPLERERYRFLARGLDGNIDRITSVYRLDIGLDDGELLVCEYETRAAEPPSRWLSGFVGDEERGYTLVLSSLCRFSGAYAGESGNWLLCLDDVDGDGVREMLAFVAGPRGSRLHGVHRFNGKLGCFVFHDAGGSSRSLGRVSLEEYGRIRRRGHVEMWGYSYSDADVKALTRKIRRLREDQYPAE